MISFLRKRWYIFLIIFFLFLIFFSGFWVTAGPDDETSFVVWLAVAGALISGIGSLIGGIASLIGVLRKPRK